MVHEMAAEDRSKLLRFCHGSSRSPATGFVSLMGYQGAEHAFIISRTHGGDSGRLPTAHTCFNKLDLPEYATEAELRAKFRVVLTEAEGFHEGAVAT